MPPGNITWTLKMVSEAAKPYKTRADFERYNCKAYQAAKYNGWLDSICGHMLEGANGYRASKQGALYVVQIVLLSKEYIGFGISNNIDKRLRAHKASATKHGATISVLQLYEFKNGADAMILESTLKDLLPIVDTGISGFKTEAVDIEHTEMLFSIINAYKKQVRPKTTMSDITTSHFNATKMLKEVLKQHKKLQVKVSQYEDLSELPQDLLAKKVTKEGCTGGTWLPNELLQHYQEWLKSVGSRHKDIV